MKVTRIVTKLRIRRTCQTSFSQAVATVDARFDGYVEQTKYLLHILAVESIETRLYFPTTRYNKIFLKSVDIRDHATETPNRMECNNISGLN